MANIRDAEDAYMTAKLDFEKWLQEFETEWYAPIIAAQVEFLQRTAPAQQNEVGNKKELLDKIIKRISGGY